MKKILTLLALAPALVFAQAKTEGFTLTGKITGIADGPVKLITGNEQATVLASGQLKQGSFTLNGSVPEPGLYFLSIGSEQPQSVFLENHPIKVSGSKTGGLKLKVEGSSSHKDYEALNTMFMPMINELNSLANTLNSEADPSKKDRLMGQYNTVVSKITTEITKVISTRKSSYVSSFLLANARGLYSDIAVLEKQLNSLDAPVRNSYPGKTVAAFIADSKIGMVGSDALNFTQTDTNGQPVALSSFRGKYVLVDFWASWCRPCRQENPNVVKAFHKFKDRNFTILGVSLDQNKDSWMKAINDDHLAWNHVSDLRQWQNEVAQLYHIQSIPQNFLIDPNGKIIAKDLRGEDLEKKLCELLGCN
jgi:peroxiredoxin